MTHSRLKVKHQLKEWGSLHVPASNSSERRKKSSVKKISSVCRIISFAKPTFLPALPFLKRQTSKFQVFFIWEGVTFGVPITFLLCQILSNHNDFYCSFYCQLWNYFNYVSFKKWKTSLAGNDNYLKDCLIRFYKLCGGYF